jgi:23S rRNA pseudouridine2605 synthase
LNKSSESSGLRLQVYLARCGLGSRRGCELLIEKGRVAINGVPVTRPGEKVVTGDVVTVDGRKVAATQKKVYIALHKPPGYLCANADPEHRPLARDLFRSAISERLFHVGRLDFLSSGLILFTNDGDFTKIVSHPAARIEKEYLVETGREIDEDFLRRYLHGIQVGEVIYRCKAYTLRGPHSAHITLTEGKNRELRNVFISRNIRLKRVHRLRIGPLTLRGIAAGHFRRLTEREVKWFFDHAAAPGPAPRKPRRAARPTASPARTDRPGAPRKDRPTVPRKSRPNVSRRDRSNAPRRDRGRRD